MNEFSLAYQDFTKHYVEISEDQMKVYEKAAEQYWSEIEKKAEKLEVTCDYYLMEFM
jgi:hypothetical protein